MQREHQRSHVRHRDAAEPSPPPRHGDDPSPRDLPAPRDARRRPALVPARARPHDDGRLPPHQRRRQAGAVGAHARAAHGLRALDAPPVAAHAFARALDANSTGVGRRVRSRCCRVSPAAAAHHSPSRRLQQRLDALPRLRNALHEPALASAADLPRDDNALADRRRGRADGADRRAAPAGARGAVPGGQRAADDVLPGAGVRAVRGGGHTAEQQGRVRADAAPAAAAAAGVVGAGGPAGHEPVPDAAAPRVVGAARGIRGARVPGQSGGRACCVYEQQRHF